MNLMFSYSLNKFNLLRRMSKPYALGSELPKEMVETYISKMIVSFTVGCILFQWMLYDKIELLTIIMCGITIFYKLLPINKIIDKIYHVQKRHVSTINYQVNNNKKIVLIYLIYLQDAKKAFCFE